ncbi:MAG TPA: hypothetical protein VHT95_13715 [Vicinamibacterales bacterium]|nr:hypothetical protein [Vicinamibacterales bacterium]
MVRNYPHPITAHEGLRMTVGDERTGGFARMMESLRQMFCGLRGHDTLLHFEDERMSLRCVSCGHETPGWELNEVPPTVTVRGDARRHVIARPKLVSERRIA